jgi:hypothetical protein
VAGMVSAEGESFDLRTPVPCDGPVETWMSAVEVEMRRTLAAVTKEGVFYYAQTPRSRWIGESLGMVTLAGSQVGALLHVWQCGCSTAGAVVSPRGRSLEDACCMVLETACRSHAAVFMC